MPGCTREGCHSKYYMAECRAAPHPRSQGGQTTQVQAPGSPHQLDTTRPSSNRRPQTLLGPQSPPPVLQEWHGRFKDHQRRRPRKLARRSAKPLGVEIGKCCSTSRTVAPTPVSQPVRVSLCPSFNDPLHPHPRTLTACFCQAPTLTFISSSTPVSTTVDKPCPTTLTCPECLPSNYRDPTGCGCFLRLFFGN